MNLTFIFTLVLIFGFNFVNTQDIEKSGQSRVVGGQTATKSYPYQVSVDNPALYGLGGVVTSWHHFCGGSIISNRHVLTAAHCIIENGQYTPTDEMSILAGTNDLNSEGTRYYPMKNIAHPKYLTDIGGFDIAIITVKGIIRFVLNKVEPIKYTHEETGGDVHCVLTGWGSTGKLSSGPYPTDLQELQVSTISNTECKSSDTTYSHISSTNICTLSPKGQGACSGDSGGPLVDLNKNVLVGIAEAVNGGGCAIGKPDIFTRVSAFYYWIEKNTKADMSSMVPTAVKIPGFQGK